MNIGFEGDELKPYLEPESDLNDEGRIRESLYTMEPIVKDTSILIPNEVLSHMHEYFMYMYLHVRTKPTLVDRVFTIVDLVFIKILTSFSYV